MTKKSWFFGHARADEELRGSREVTADRQEEDDATPAGARHRLGVEEVPDDTAADLIERGRRKDAADAQYRDESSD